MEPITLRLLYLMNDPFGTKNLLAILEKRFGEEGKRLIEQLSGLSTTHKDSVKVGSSGLTKYQTRIGNYQQGNGPNNLIEWPICYIGEQSVINRLEERIKDSLEHNRLESRLGEWYDNHTAETIAPTIEAIIDGNRFKVKKVDPKFLPIAYEIGWKTQKEMVEHYQKTSILCDFLIG